MMTLLPIDDFSPITLAELLGEAELLSRVDRKYLLDDRQAAALLRGLDVRTRVLTVDGHRQFHYESVYFDTPDLLSYRQSAHGRRRRFKVRTRTYLDSGLSFVEVKVRGDRQSTVKERIEHPLELRHTLTASSRDYAEATLRVHGMDASAARHLAPTLLTNYTRTTLVPPESNVRVTVDTDLTWRDGGRKLTLPGMTIVETKSGSGPSTVDRLLWRSGHRPTSISKYSTGLAALRGDLPANKWARILRHHFHNIEELPCAA